MSTVGTDARERLIRYAAGFIGGEDWDEYLLAAEEWVDALLSEGCRGDLAEAAGFQSYAQNLRMGCEIGERKGRRVTALKIADAIAREMTGVGNNWDRYGMQQAERIARSFTEEDSDKAAMLAGATDRLNDPLTPDTPGDIRARLESSDE